MRVLIDTNVLVSYLLNPHNAGSVNTIIDGLFQGQFTLLVPDALLVELTTTARDKPHLAKRITPGDLTTFANALQALGERVPKISEQIPSVTRDIKDDYLIAYALIGRADFLVTGDKDLLALRGLVTGVEIVTPAQFVKFLQV
jgi:putative PIN family toxin of toxin-antitoxin system